MNLFFIVFLLSSVKIRTNPCVCGGLCVALFLHLWSFQMFTGVQRSAQTAEKLLKISFIFCTSVKIFLLLLLL